MSIAVAAENGTLCAGHAARGDFRCQDCGYGVTIQRALPVCPMCRGEHWEAGRWLACRRLRSASAFAKTRPLKGGGRPADGVCEVASPSRQHALFELARDLSSTLELDEVARAFTTHAPGLTGGDAGIWLLHDRPGGSCR